MPTIQMSRKQATAWKLLDDPTVTELDYGGGAGGGKSLLICLWAASQCKRYPGIRIGIGRKELKRLKETTLVTLRSKAHKILGVEDGDYVYNDQKGLLRYKNGSEIMLADLNWQPSDPEYDTFGSLEFTHTITEEAGEVRKKGDSVFSSRRNRWLNTEYGIVGKHIRTTNPTENFMRDESYDIFVGQGGGDYQKWPNGEVVVGNVQQTAYRAFVRSLITDNPFADANYALTLAQLPTPERKRLLEGNWDFASSDAQLFPTALLTGRLTDEYPEEGRSFLGVDIADEGKDETWATHTKGGVLIDQIEVKVTKNEKVPIGHQIGQWIIDFATAHGIPPVNIGIDAAGVGASCRDYLRSKGFTCQEYVGGSASPKKTYKNLRSESHYDLHDRLEKAEARVSRTLSTKDELFRQARAIEYEIVDGILKLEKREALKEKLQRSPDLMDSWNIANWAEHGDMDKRYNKNRIGY